jgi:hypothetical protein
MNGLPKNIHVVPIGHEIDRAVRPFDHWSADKVYILAVTDRKKYTKEMIDQQEHFTRRVTEGLEERRIATQVIAADLFDVLTTMQHISYIIRQERDAGNNVYVNISACGRLTSIATAFAAMAVSRDFGDEKKTPVMVYYVHADRYSETKEERLQHGLSICTGEKIMEFENFQIVMPDPVSTDLLAYLMEKRDGIETDELFDFLRERKVEEFEKDFRSPERDFERRRAQSKYLMMANNRYLNKLQRQGYIAVKKQRLKKIISITRAGRHIASISGRIQPSRDRFH